MLPPIIFVAIGQRKTVHILDNKGLSVPFMINPRKIGPIKIKFEANCNIASDAIEKVLRVLPESHLFEKTERRFFELYDNTNQIEFSINLNIPRNIDEGSESIIFRLDRKYFFFFDPRLDYVTLNHAEPVKLFQLI